MSKCVNKKIDAYNNLLKRLCYFLSCNASQFKQKNMKIIII